MLLQGVHGLHTVFFLLLRCGLLLRSTVPKAALPGTQTVLYDTVGEETRWAYRTIIWAGVVK